MPASPLPTAELIAKAADNAAALKDAQVPSASQVWKQSPAGFGSVESLAAATGASLPPAAAEAQRAKAATDKALNVLDDPAAQAKAKAEERAKQEAMGLMAGVLLEAIAPDMPTPGLPEPKLPELEAPGIDAPELKASKVAAPQQAEPQLEPVDSPPPH